MAETAYYTDPNVIKYIAGKTKAEVASKFPVSVANGGTGATTQAGILSNLGISNRVIAEGTSGVWYWRKYSNKKCEMWGFINGINISTSYAGVWYADSTANLPFTVVNDDYHIYCSVIASSACCFANCYEKSGTQVKLRTTAIGGSVWANTLVYICATYV